MIPVILSGGAGTRLWPLSRKHYPKQLHRLMNEQRTLLQDTALRVSGLQAPVVVCNEDHRFMVAEQLHSIGITPAAILLEPAARNTAPAIALAALQALTIDPDATLAILPADHAIADTPALLAALEVAGEAAADSSLVTFGVVPTHPETGYGYLQSQEKSGNVRHVSRFVEKPDRPTAEQYVAAGDHFWNSGMFVFRARAYLDARSRYQPADAIGTPTPTRSAAPTGSANAARAAKRFGHKEFGGRRRGVASRSPVFARHGLRHLPAAAGAGGIPCRRRCFRRTSSVNHAETCGGFSFEERAKQITLGYMGNPRGMHKASRGRTIVKLRWDWRPWELCPRI